MKYLRAFFKDKFLLIGAFFILLPSGFQFFLGQAGQVFLSHPQSQDKIFNNTVLYMVDHTIDGAMALVLNKPYPKDKVQNIPPYIAKRNIPVFWGGPVNDKDDIFIVAFDGTEKPKIMMYDEWIAEDSEILDKVQSSPEKFRILMGYAGWQALQFELERLASAWFVGVKRATFFPELLKTTAINQKSLWIEILKKSDFYKNSAILGGGRA